MKHRCICCGTTYGTYRDRMPDGWDRWDGGVVGGERCELCSRRGKEPDGFVASRLARAGR